MDGYIKIFRQLLNWEWYTDGTTFRVFMHLLLSANFKPSRFRGFELPVGALVVSIDSLASALKLSNQQIRTALKKLESTGEINKQITNKFSIITICKWESYQCDFIAEQQTNNKQITNNQQTNNKQITTEEEYKKERKKEDSIIDCCENSQPNEQIKPTKKTIEERRNDFYNDIAQYVGKYDREMLRAFYDYWSEENQQHTKMRFEMEKTWATGGRLATWKRRQLTDNKQLNYKNNGQQRRKITDEEIIGAVADGLGLHFAKQQTNKNN